MVRRRRSQQGLHSNYQAWSAQLNSWILYMDAIFLVSVPILDSYASDLHDALVSGALSPWRLRLRCPMPAICC
jgi:hypothetical protein